MKRTFSEYSGKRKDDECCAKCRDLFGTVEGLKAAGSDAGYHHWSSKAELRTGSKTCKLCRIVWEAIPWQAARVKGALHIYARAKGLPPLVQLASSSNRSFVSEVNTLEVRDSLADNRNEVLVRLYLCSEEDDPASAIVKRRPTSVKVNGQVAIDQVHRWLSDCQRSHILCSRKQMSQLPTRLIDVSWDEHGSTVCVRPTRGLQGTYVALSYCWGTLNQPVTTRGNIAAREGGFPVETLPQTIQDAIHFTKKLGIRYLWIDAICIIQDDEADRTLQIASMGMIYKEATLTLAAANSSSAWDGFLQDRCRPDGAVNLPMRVSPSISGSVTVAREQHYVSWEEPLHCRGWSLQELFLSRRILLFGKHELIWRCSTQEWLPSQTALVHYDVDFHALPTQMLGYGLRPPANLQDQQLRVWADIVDNYSGRTLSIPTDRVLALVGIATELSIAWRDTYVLGLWSRTFIHNLAWRVHDYTDQRQKRPGRPFENVPSWSWLSASCRTAMYPGLSTADASLLAPPNGLRQIMTVEDMDAESKIITLRARTLTDLYFLRRPFESSLYHELGKSSYFLILDLDPMDVREADLLVALLGFVKGGSSYALCLLLQLYEASDAAEVWERVGRIQIYDFDWSSVAYSTLSIR